MRFSFAKREWEKPCWGVQNIGNCIMKKKKALIRGPLRSLPFTFSCSIICDYSYVLIIFLSHKYIFLEDKVIIFEVWRGQVPWKCRIVKKVGRNLGDHTYHNDWDLRAWHVSIVWVSKLNMFVSNIFITPFWLHPLTGHKLSL